VRLTPSVTSPHPHHAHDALCPDLNVRRYRADGGQDGTSASRDTERR